MPVFLPGQRWISDSESELGLGTVIECEGRTVTLHFPAIGENRVYARQGAPLTRVAFSVGDRVERREGGTLLVQKVVEKDGCLTYLGEDQEGEQTRLTEADINDTLRINQPNQRLLAGQIDPPHWFNLRYQTLQHMGHHQQSPVLGLGGPRIDLIPHQLYIAHEIANRPTPRVLLADEVGLGKTIEACLILHHQLITGRTSRALILVPDPLVHQWLIELLRRFNLRFRIFDEETCQAIQDSGQGDNPFHAEQLVLCSLDLFHHNPERLSQALDGDWDMLIVDEAHHLTWSAEDPSAEYLLVEALALKTPGVLLLTATPEQLGQAGHFARLRLLDPDRYYDLQTFQQEEHLYQPVADAAEQLLVQNTLPGQATKQLLDTLDENESTPLLTLLGDNHAGEEQRSEAREALINLLLDRHGTGRVLFRNTRVRISGFPDRELHAYPLTLPDCYEDREQQSADAQPGLLLTPERHYAFQGHPSWWHEDPRVAWLKEMLRKHPTEKFLLICAYGQTAIELQEAIRVQTGIGAGLFHEQMSIIERDRAAAWFADPNGARLLICSEIGSEGRNFQFAHHLILFDLPLDPDLLEQRIGRLDRIGQKKTVQIHVPYLEPGPQSVMLHWYRDGLDAFRHHVPGANEVREQLASLLWETLEGSSRNGDQEKLIDTTRQLREETQQRLQQGRDHLLELGACREPTASRLVSQLREQDQSQRLHNYLDQLFNSYNIDTEELGEAGLILRPGDQVIAGTLPGLPADGMTVTFSRKDALAHEERQFLTWEHPLVSNAMEQIIGQQTGNSAALACRHPRLKAGQLLLECLFVLECPAPRHLQAGRFLPPTLIRLLLNPKGERLDHLITCEALLEHAQALETQSILPVINAYRPQIQKLMSQAESTAQGSVTSLVNSAIKQMMEHYTQEIQRMMALKKHNPGVREEEIQLLQDQGMALHQHLQSARLRLDAIRMVVTLA
ncbi:MAG: RNA polymerase-associated protein RapA [Candidatus Thiodiazotropha sp. (ex Rostrolucina anterorostrata)]|nr:RNA polymerase-associated protein RapA [Candidatus Thiodiazotropha sp. (ex Rostrolucina anterorostrata)]